MHLQGKALMSAITAVCGLGFLLFGYDQGVMGGVIGSPTFKERFHDPNATKQGLVVGLYDLGCLIGSLTTFGLSKFRRRTCICGGASIVIIGTILQVTATTIGQLIAGRIITGIGVGTNTAIIPSWQAEVSSAHSRGALITVEAALIIFGLAISNWICFGASHATSSLQWQFPIAFQCIFALCLICIAPFLVESPRWTAHHVSIQKAREVAARLNGSSEDDHTVQQVIGEIEQALEAEGTSRSVFDIFRHGGQQNFRRMLLGVGGLFMQQMTGINAVAYYMPVILQEYVDLPHDLALILSSAAAVQFFIVSLIPIWVIERLGRRTWMIWGAFAQMVTLIFVVAGFNIGGRGGGILVTTMFFLFYDAFAVSYLNIPWLYAPEINNLQMRAQGSALASASNWLFNGIVVTITPIALSQISWRYWIVWVAMNFAFMPLVYFCYPETQGLSLERIDNIFAGDVGHGFSAFTQGVRESVVMVRGEHFDPPFTSGDEEKSKDTAQAMHRENSI
ncbi:hypothetical protein BFJ72_g5422 [Fusarium proliferatum]|uniref:Major facilitator superfamily (MFS) profile domain-containing protein n=1 Tax=Gibberella intermedia TaxID=948311 RepID=A0A420TJ09_GIBIN|nr:hypothetical protein BFJ72_g5422 [Fusarium proliferatum]